MDPNSDYPITSFRKLLLPTQLTKVAFFEDQSLSALESRINAWVDTTKSLVVSVSPPEQRGDEVITSVTYIKADGNG